MEIISLAVYKSFTGTRELARIKGGFLIKEMLERFSKKINLTLNPNRSIWLYSAHDLVIINELNTLGLYEVNNSLKLFFNQIDLTNMFLFLFSLIFHHVQVVCILNCINLIRVNTTSKFTIENHKKILSCPYIYQDVPKNVH